MIDVCKLMGGVVFTVSCSLSLNGNMITKIFALSDTGVLGFSFINSHCASTVAEFTGAPLRKPKKYIIIKGYNGRTGKSVTHYLECNLTFDNSKLLRILFPVLDLGNHNLILGSHWFSHYDIKPDLRCRHLE